MLSPNQAEREPPVIAVVMLVTGSNSDIYQFLTAVLHLPCKLLTVNLGLINKACENLPVCLHLPLV